MAGKMGEKIHLLLFSFFFFSFFSPSFCFYLGFDQGDPLNHHLLTFSSIPYVDLSPINMSWPSLPKNDLLVCGNFLNPGQTPFGGDVETVWNASCGFFAKIPAGSETLHAIWDIRLIQVFLSGYVLGDIDGLIRYEANVTFHDCKKATQNNEGCVTPIVMSSSSDIVSINASSSPVHIYLPTADYPNYVDNFLQNIQLDFSEKPQKVEYGLGSFTITDGSCTDFTNRTCIIHNPPMSSSFQPAEDSGPTGWWGITVYTNTSLDFSVQKNYCPDGKIGLNCEHDFISFNYYEMPQMLPYKFTGSTYFVFVSDSQATFSEFVQLAVQSVSGENTPNMQLQIDNAPISKTYAPLESFGAPVNRYQSQNSWLPFSYHLKYVIFVNATVGEKFQMWKTGYLSNMCLQSCSFCNPPDYECVCAWGFKGTACQNPWILILIVVCVMASMLIAAAFVWMYRKKKGYIEGDYENMNSVN